MFHLGLELERHPDVRCTPKISFCSDRRPPGANIDRGRHKGKISGSLYSSWMATKLARNGWATEEVRSELRKAYCRTQMLDGLHQNNGECGPESLNAENLCHLGPETDHATYASLLRLCISNKTLSGGKVVHEHISRSRYAGNRFLSNLLIQMYSKCGSLENARAVFDKIIHRDTYSWNIIIAAAAQNGALNDARALFAEMPQRDVVSWNSMIAACARNGHDKDALQLFGEMQAEGFEPNKITIICFVDACASLTALRAIHSTIAGNGWESDRVVGTALTNMYGKCGSLEDAREAFVEMPQRNVISWSAMITACAQNGHVKNALQVFRQMQGQGFKPNKITFLCVVDACARVAALEEGRLMHASVSGNRWDSDVSMGNAFVNMYGKCSSLDDARAVFAEMPQQDVVSWSAMVAACAQNGHGKEALHLFGQMQAKCIEPNDITLLCVVDACATLEEGRLIHATVTGDGRESHVVVGNALINLYGKCRRLDDSRAVFAEMPHQDVVSWNAMITACVQNDHSNEAIQLCGQMLAEGFEANKITFTSVVDACASVAALEEARVIHASVAGNGWVADVIVGTALVNMYGKCGSVDDAVALFGGMPQRDVVSWNAMITAYAENGHGNEALHLFSQMQAKGFELRQITFICIVDACASVAALEEGHMVHATAACNSWALDIVVGNALVNMYGKCGSLDDALAVFAEITVRDVVSWNAMISTFAQNGHGKEGLQLFGQMQAQGFQPDKITFVCVLTACSHTGLVADARAYFASMNRDHGINPSVEHYVCMIDLLGRRGLLEDAEDLIISMPFQQVPSAWTSLLSSCKIHNDVERAARAAKFVVELGPRTASPYVIASDHPFLMQESQLM